MRVCCPWFKMLRPQGFRFQIFLEFGISYAFIIRYLKDRTPSKTRNHVSSICTSCPWPKGNFIYVFILCVTRMSENSQILKYFWLHIFGLRDAPAHVSVTSVESNALLSAVCIRSVEGSLVGRYRHRSAGNLCSPPV